METRVVVNTWRQFDRKVRRSNVALLSRLDRYRDAVLVAGCQRSGTTVLSRIFRGAQEMTDHTRGADEELDGALILAGLQHFDALGRCCFQTTYLNDAYREYFGHSGYRLVWAIRNPHSVVFSMLHHWRRGALNRLFRGCGADLLSRDERGRFERFGVFAIGRVRRACLSYNAKMLQLHDLVRHMPPERLKIVEYDHLVERKEEILPELFEFVGLQYSTTFVNLIRPEGISRAKRQDAGEAEIVSELCMPAYHEARRIWLRAA